MAFIGECGFELIDVYVPIVVYVYLAEELAQLLDLFLGHLRGHEICSDLFELNCRKFTFENLLY